MKGKASAICPNCKHCEGLDRFVNMYSCKHYNKYPDSAIGMDSEIDCCNFEEVNMNKVEGKVSDICPNCKNCKGITKESNGVHDWLTEVECEDPYDGMTKTLDADSNVCCSMFEAKKEKEPFNLNMSRALSEICSDYDKRCKEECEKKYRNEISKLQNIVTEKEVEIKGLKSDIIVLHQNKFLADTAMEKNNKLKQTISDQEITIKALLITIKEMCKDE